MQLQFTKQQLDFLIKEANKQQTTIERYIQQLVDIQIDMQEALETDDMWDEVDTSI